MTLDEFLETLEKYGKGKFEILPDETIRHQFSYSPEDRLCPIEFVYAKLKHKAKKNVVGTYCEGGHALGLDLDLKWDIVGAADNAITDPRGIRNAILSTLNLEERRNVE